MKVVVIERVESKSAAILGLQKTHVLRFVFSRQHDRPALAVRCASRLMAQDMFGGIVQDRLRGVGAQAVEMELVDPVTSIGDEKISHRSRIGVVEVDRLAPFIAMSVAGVGRRKLFEKIAGQSEMVVNHVQQHPDADRVRLIDESPQVVGRAVQPRRSIEIDSIISPPIAAGKIGDGHHLHQRDAGLGQLAKLLVRRVPRSLGRERADVHFVDHLSIKRDPRPVGIGPGERTGVDDLRGAERALGLKPRRRIGKDSVLTPVKTKAVSHPGLRSRHEGREVALFSGFELDGLKPARLVRLEDDFDSLPPRRPNAKVNAAA